MLVYSREEVLCFGDTDQREQEHPLALHALAAQLQSVNYAFDAIISKCLIKFRNGFQSNTWDHNAFILQNGGHLAFKIENRQENVAMCKY